MVLSEVKKGQSAVIERIGGSDNHFRYRSDRLAA